MTAALWSITQSRALYNIEHWSDGYFDINPAGHVTVSTGQNKPAVDLYELAQSLPTQGLSYPVLVRFSGILHHRVEKLHQAFTQAMQQENYPAKYTPVYPIKVNQQHHVVKEILNTGKVGLEAGSKPELLAVMALAPEQGIVICNGYKDSEYIRLALIGQQIGLKVYLVIEKSSELETIIEEANRMGIKPRLGVRVRLASLGKGKWQNTGGEKAKFGLSATHLLEVLKRIEAAGLTECLQLMHFHIGSQVANIMDVQQSLSEAAHYYTQLRLAGMPIDTVDVGGGLGIDYDGTASRNACSINYSIQEYANNIVAEFATTCQEYSLPYPNLVTESGRAMTAHHAVLITNVTDIEFIPQHYDATPPTENEPTILHKLWQGLNNLTPHSAFEAYHDAAYWLGKAHGMFADGMLTLEQRACAEKLYFATCQQVRPMLQANSKAHREVLDELNDKMADKYFCNFSLFQSVPDAWAIDQLFPIMPLHHLDELPERRATLQDLTCDSDGQFENYVDGAGIETSLPVHLPRDNEPYLLGIFLVGAYQEILGDMHNLFGDTYSVNVKIDAAGHYELVEPQEGDTVQDMLRYVHLDTDMLRNNYRKRLQSAHNLTPEQRQSYQRHLEAGLMGYTYLEP